ncbi:TPA: hypothetical protein RLV06_000922 [Escherichia coli]|nr:hypothetical protein [Escherichia coli]EFH6232852.1 hypothetical protein [Escherichia coli]EGZ8533432.1 hypothetical protein [Escherichia coli]ELN7488052.1 hypothetical protein [Escherichia coli]ELT6886553.1 hypothetical protein [Escherichia coli]
MPLINRIVLPPMTRSRAGAGDVAIDMMAEYNAQRASAGLIICEGTQISRSAAHNFPRHADLLR